ncbi:MAG: flagellar basal body-associated FliL family protein [Armatimonadetes bacterium]|jgi:flagellar FliL protein|nr:flagellar basal body-associated FliL family protein [Armatimonadota bacterium]
MSVGTKGKVAIIIMAIVMVIACAVAGVAVLQKKAPPPKGKIPVVEEPGDMLPIGELIVNLADTPEIHYLKTDIILEVTGKLPTTEGDDTAVKAPLRDAIISVLSSKRLAEINKPCGKEQLKTELVTACEKCLKTVRVQNVYFSDFAMQ